MGPGSFDPGSGQPDASCARPNSCFNGAGVFRPRKCYLCHYRLGGRAGFNGAGVFRPRKSNQQCSLGRPASSFNGAGVFRPRKLSKRAVCTARRMASMGPGSFDPGSTPAAVAAIQSNTGFNGAGVFRPRKSRTLYLPSAKVPSFNGAGVFRPRKCLSKLCTKPPIGSFNGAGVFRPRKYPLRFWRGRMCNLLQWGRGLSTPEVEAVILAVFRAGLASMGPGSFDPGSHCSALPNHAIYCRFNGAGVFRPRKCRR